MQTEKMMSAMRTSISDVFETMFFMPVDFEPAALGAPETDGDGGTLTARLAFDGARSGYFRLRIPEGLARRVSADFMGMEPGAVSTEDIAGTVLEMVNMMAGNTFSAYDPQTVFNLQGPVLVGEGEPAPPAEAGATVIEVSVDTLESRMHLDLVLRPERS